MKQTLAVRLYGIGGDSKLGCLCGALAHCVWAAQRAAGNKTLMPVGYQLTEAAYWVRQIPTAGWTRSQGE